MSFNVNQRLSLSFKANKTAAHSRATSQDAGKLLCGLKESHTTKGCQLPALPQAESSFGKSSKVPLLQVIHASRDASSMSKQGAISHARGVSNLS